MSTLSDLCCVAKVTLLYLVCCPGALDCLLTGDSSCHGDYHGHHLSNLMQHETLAFDLDHAELVPILHERVTALE